MSEVMVREIEVGIDGSSGVRCGVIGEIGCSYPLMDVEKRALQAAASAQTKTGEKERENIRF
jgi:phosphotriesterase-related protein